MYATYIKQNEYTNILNNALYCTCASPTQWWLLFGKVIEPQQLESAALLVILNITMMYTQNAILEINTQELLRYSLVQ